MKADKKLSIKVKSKKEQRSMASPEVEMITEWNAQRIILALIALMLLLVLPAYYFSTQDDSTTTQQIKNASLDSSKDMLEKSPVALSYDSVQNEKGDIQKIESAIIQNKPDIKKTDLIKPTLVKEDIALVSSRETLENVPLETPPPRKSFEKASKDVIADSVIEKQVLSIPLKNRKYLSKNISRAGLVQGFSKSEPYGQAKLPVMVNEIKAEGLFFFTEVKNMQGRTVFHEWLKEGKTMYKYKFVMRSNEGKMHTSKLFTYSSAGQWQVRIITPQGKILHKVDFSVQQLIN